MLHKLGELISAATTNCLYLYFQIIQYFQVTEIDEGLLQLRNLKKLSLSANFIKQIDSIKLPKGLEVQY